MAWADIEAKLNITGYGAGDAAVVKAAVKAGYDGSATARAMLDGWIATAGHVININFVANAANAVLNSGTVSFDPAGLANASYIDNNGTAIGVQNTHVLMHELVHATLGLSDNNNNTTDYQGDTVKKTNVILTELGLPERNSYISVGGPTILTEGFKYTNGAAIDKSESGNRDWNSGPAGNSKDLLIGGAGANTLQSGAGNDFLFGAGGNDNLDGGAGTDTIVFKGKPTDYDIRVNADGSWTSRNVRGAADEGTDTINNAERVMFKDGEAFNLAKGGLTFQTDFSFVIDTTGSMFDDIDAVKASATGVINALFAGDTIDARINVVTFKDAAIGEPSTINLSFTDQDVFADRKTAALAAINGISVGGGGDFPETAFDGLLKALDGSAGEWRVGSGVKKVALFTDATAKDTFLLPTVLTYATNIGATISFAKTEALGTIGAVDTFELTFAPQHFDPGSEGDGVTSPPLDPITHTPLGGKAIVQVTTIFISGFTSPDPNLKEVSDETGGSVLLAAGPDEVVARLLEFINTATYSIGVSTSEVHEGNSGSTDVTFTVSRDRGDDAATVALSLGGTADGSDFSGVVPTSVSFAEGELSKDIVLHVLGDLSPESNETIVITIDDVTGGASTIATDVATVTILDDDGSVGIVRLEGDGKNNPLNGTDAAELIIGKGGSDRMSGGDGGDIFGFFASDRNGHDTITDFSEEDVLVTDVKIRDGNGDNIIDFGADRTLDLSSNRTVSLVDEDGNRVRFVEFDGVYHDDSTGTDYYVYSMVGSAAGVGTLTGVAI